MPPGKEFEGEWWQSVILIQRSVVSAFGQFGKKFALEGGRMHTILGV
jgi:hypothetical protein